MSAAATRLGTSVSVGCKSKRNEQGTVSQLTFGRDSGLRLPSVSIYLFIYRYCSTEYAAYSLLGEEDAARLPLEQFKGVRPYKGARQQANLVANQQLQPLPLQSDLGSFCLHHCESDQRCSKGHYSEVELLTRTLLEPTRTRGAEQIDRPPFKPSAAKRFYSNLLGLTRLCGAEQALLASPEICFGADLAPWSTVVIYDCQRAKSVCLYPAHSAPIQLQRV